MSHFLMANVEGATPYAYLSLEQTKRKRFPYAVAFSMVALLFATACFVWCVAAQAHGVAQPKRLANWKTMATVPQKGALSSGGLVRGNVVWQAFGVWNFTGPTNRWNSYADYSPADNTGAKAIRATAATIPQGQYVLDYSLSVAANCAPYNTPCVSTTNQTLCPHLGLYISCVDSFSGQSMIQSNFCPVGSVPPGSFQTCMGPPQDNANYLIGHRFARLNSAGAVSITAGINTNGLGSSQIVDFSQAEQGNCSLVILVTDSCNNKFPYPMDYFSTLYFNMYNAVPAPVSISY